MSRARKYGVGNAIFAFAMLAFFVAAVVLGWGYPSSARLAPLLVGGLGIVVTLSQVGIEILESRRARGSAQEAEAEGEVEAPDINSSATTLGDELRLGGAFLTLVVGVLLLGFWITAPLFIGLFLRFRERISWPLCIFAAGMSEAVIYGVFWELLHIQLFPGALINLITS